MIVMPPQKQIGKNIKKFTILRLNFFIDIRIFDSKTFLVVFYSPLFTFFCIHKKIIGAKIFDIRFSMDLHVLRCPEHDLTIFRKCLSLYLSVCLYVCLQYFVDTVSQELIRGNWWNLIFSCTFMGLRAD